MNCWVFQANPKIYRVDAALEELSEHTWTVNQHRKEIAAGDEVFVWRCGENAALVAAGTVLTDPAMLEAFPEEQRFEAQPLKLDGKRLRVKIRTGKLWVETRLWRRSQFFNAGPVRIFVLKIERQLQFVE